MITFNYTKSADVLQEFTSFFEGNMENIFYRVVLGVRKVIKELSGRLINQLTAKSNIYLPFIKKILILFNF